jgi:hypothetical protein
MIGYNLAAAKFLRRQTTLEDSSFEAVEESMLGKQLPAEKVDKKKRKRVVVKS